MFKTKYLPNIFAPIDSTALEHCLKQQMKKGWVPDRITPNAIRFHRTDPKDAAFAVTYLPYANEYDPKMPFAQEVYIDMCSEEGWELLLIKGSMHVFMHDDPDAVPVETDEELKLRMLERATSPEYIKYQLALTIIPFPLLLLLSFFFISGPASFTAIGILVNVYSALICSFLRGPIEVIWYYIWRSKSRKKVHSGHKCHNPMTYLRLAIRVSLYLPTLSLILLVLSCIRPRYFIPLIAIAVSLFFWLITKAEYWLLKKAKEKHERDIFVEKHFKKMRYILLMPVFLLPHLPFPIYDDISIVLPEIRTEFSSKEDFPATLDGYDILDNDIEYIYVGSIEETFLSRHESYSHEPKEYESSLPNLNYSVYKVTFAPLREMSFHALDRHKEFEEHEVLDPTPFGADRLIKWQTYNKNIIFYLSSVDDYIIYLNMPVKLSSDQRNEIIANLISYCKREV